MNEHDVFAPRSLFCDLADLTAAELSLGKRLLLTLYCGDASEAYIVRIEFDVDHVRRRTVASALSPDQPLQETIYHEPVVLN